MKRICFISVLLLALSFLLLLCFSACDDIDGLDTGLGTPEGAQGDLEGADKGNDTEKEPPHEHSSSTALIENSLPATCYRAGSYDAVSYCDGCGKELSRIQKTEAKLTHLFEGGICIHCNDPKASEGLLFVPSGNGTCSVSGIGSCTDKDIVIPKVSPDGDKVTALAPKAFFLSTSITSIYIPDSVTLIGAGAFESCVALESVTLSKSITSIEGNTFRNCYALSSITIPGGVVTIGSGAFQGCKALTHIEIPTSVKTIGACAFQSFNSNYGLKTVRFSIASGWSCSLGATLVPDVSGLSDESTAAVNLSFRFAEYTWKRLP